MYFCLLNMNLLPKFGYHLTILRKIKVDKNNDFESFHDGVSSIVNFFF